MAIGGYNQRTLTALLPETKARWPLLRLWPLPHLLHTGQFRTISTTFPTRKFLGPTPIVFGPPWIVTLVFLLGLEPTQEKNNDKGNEKRRITRRKTATGKNKGNVNGLLRAGQEEEPQDLTRPDRL